MRETPKDGGNASSIWMDAAQPRFDTPPDLETEVCVVGAGIAGLTTAFELARQGRRVTVLDDGPIGGGETGRTSAHLASAVDDHYYILETKFGEAGARLVAHSHAAAIDWIETAVQELGIDCDFRRVDGYLIAPPGESDDRTLDKELVAAERAGLVVERVAQAPLPFDTGPALRFAQQAELHPLRYLRGLAEALVARGGKIHTGVHVEAIEATGDAARPLRLRLAGGRELHCQQAVDATNATITSPVKLTLRQAAYRSYVIGFDLEAGAIPHALYWDTLDPYHYIRVAPGEDGREVLLVGGNDHRVGKGDPDAAWRDLEAWTRRWFPMVGAIVQRWSGQVLEPADLLAHIGPSPDVDHVWVVTGDSGNGLTHGTIAGILLPALMRGEHPAWERIYNPRRSHLRAAGTLVKDAVQSSMPYTEWLKPGDVKSADDIAPGEGAVIRKGLHLVATFRDEGGTCHQRSAMCPHLYGVVQWNALEKTWDCPCHGSRFDAYGRVVNGPAAADLAEIGEPLGESHQQPQTRPPAHGRPDVAAGAARPRPSKPED